jgi:phosphoglycerol transferase MdoB-like AlkP superfamily enzyme
MSRFPSIPKMLSFSRKLLLQYLAVGWLPLMLIILFVLQNYFFISWLHITQDPYILRPIAASTALGILLFGPAILLNKWMRYLYLSIVSLLVALIFSFQFLYYTYSGGFLQASALFYVGEGLTVLGTVKTLLTYRLLLFFTGFFLVAGVWIWMRIRRRKESILLLKEKIGASILIVILVILGYGYVFFKEYREVGTVSHIYHYSELYDVNGLVSKIGILNFSLGDLLTLGFRNHTANAEDIHSVQSWYQSQPQQTVPGKYFGLAKGENVILIQVESLDNAVINEKINGQEITPYLNQFVREGLYFSNYYTQIGPGNTADAEFSTLNALYALPGAVAFIEYAHNHYASLPWLVQQQGYYTSAFHGDVPSFWNRANMYPQLGYEKWFGRQDYVIPRNIGAYDLGDEDFFTQTIPKLTSLPQPFLATLITLSSHTPFALPEDLETLSIPADAGLDWLQQHYLQSIHYTDRAIGKFIEQLKQTNLYDHSLIFIFGDHGSFTNIGNALHVDKAVFPDIQDGQVPLIMLSPHAALRGVNSFPCSHLDLYPTIANLLGITLPVPLLGQDILTTQTPVVVRRYLVSGAIKSVLTDKRAYHASADGVFEHGDCLTLPDKQKVSPEQCRLLYDTETIKVHISDTMIRGDLIKTLQENTKKP